MMPMGPGRSSRPFKRLRLRPKHCEDMAKVIDTLLDETVTEYEHFVTTGQHEADKKIWKSYKSKEDIAVYKCKLDAKTRARVMPSKLVDPFEWPVPPMLGVGSLPGNIYEILYGMLAPDVEAMKVRSKCTDDECVGCDVLCQIKNGTMEDPFRSLAIKWYMLSHEPSTFSSVVYARDMVVLEGSGLHTLSDGEQIGFHLQHSIDIMQCPELRAEGVTRERTSLCFLFRQMPRNNVEVYMRIHSKPPRNMPETAAISAAAGNMLGVLKAAQCAKNSKMRFMMNRPYETPRPMGKSEKAACYLCHKPGRLLKPLSTCQLCHQPVCSRCHVAHKLIQSSESGLNESNVICCKSCIGKLAKEDAFEIAQQQCMARSRSHSNSSTSGVSFASNSSSDRSHSSVDMPARSATSTTRKMSGPKRPPINRESTSTMDASLSEFSSDGEQIRYSDPDDLDAPPPYYSQFDTINEWGRPSPMSASSRSVNSMHSAHSAQSIPSSQHSMQSSQHSMQSSQLSTCTDLEVVPMPMQYPNGKMLTNGGNVGSQPHPQAPPNARQQAQPSSEYQTQLWQQMNQLCMAAQQTYNILQDNQRAMKK